MVYENILLVLIIFYFINIMFYGFIILAQVIKYSPLKLV